MCSVALMDNCFAVRLRGKSRVGRDLVFVNDAQRVESHPLGIPIVGEAESVFGVANRGFIHHVRRWGESESWLPPLFSQ